MIIMVKFVGMNAGTRPVKMRTSREESKAALYPIFKASLPEIRFAGMATSGGSEEIRIMDVNGRSGNELAMFARMGFTTLRMDCIIYAVKTDNIVTPENFFIVGSSLYYIAEFIPYTGNI
jgi:hypothetical protein